MKVEIKIPEHTVIETTETEIIITRVGIWNLLNRGEAGRVKVPYKNISSIVYRKSRVFGGKFAIRTKDGRRYHNLGYSGLNPFRAFTAYGDKLAVVFRNGKNHEMAALNEVVQNQIHSN